jgi:hypothetical protein
LEIKGHHVAENVERTPLKLPAAIRFTSSMTTGKYSAASIVMNVPGLEPRNR